MYHEIQRLALLGFKNPRIARYLGLDKRTVNKYLTMAPEEYEAYLLDGQYRNKVLSPFEQFVKDKLTRFEDTSAAQMHDWLKEHHPDLPDVTPRTVFNFVMYVRQKHNIPVVKLGREYFSVEELPYGEQAQMDFGEYNMRISNGNRKKVRFFAMVLSRSRMKYIWFTAQPFTAQTVCQAHENAFSFFGGITSVIVYDQDRTIIVDENLGNIILTATFKQYVSSRGFKLHFCRKSDPESKGKVENVVKYVKENFLYNRLYSDLETLNTEALAWLERTANHLPHNVTKKSPQSEHRIEKNHLNPFVPLAIENKDVKTYVVRKTNNINYKSNFYSVPTGTYQGRETRVIVKENRGMVEIYTQDKELICAHKLSEEQGKIIVNTHHKRDTSKTLDEMLNEAAGYFTDINAAKEYLGQIQSSFPRYTRDHLQVMLKALTENETAVVDQALDFCLKNRLFSGHEFEQVYHVVFLEQKTPLKAQGPVKLLDGASLSKANEAPQKSNMDDYENIINP